MDVMAREKKMTIREDYNRDGYVVCRNAINPRIMLSSERELKSMLDADVGKYIGYLISSAKHVEAQRLFLDTRLLGQIISVPIIIEQPVLHVMSPTLRIPDGYYGTASHQDWPSTQGSLDCVTVWVALTDAGTGNFPLEVIPGSHKRGLLDGKMNGSVLEVEADDKEFIPIECKAGDVVFLSGFTVHRTGTGTGFRVAVSQRFDNAAEPTFIERGYPCAQKRIVDREIRWKPTAEQVRAVYGVD
jgi:hypothetical protein